MVDALLKVEAPQGPLWHRYNGDGYGEHADGSPFDGTGTGRAWPLLAGERAHYELALGCRQAAERLLRTLEQSTGEGGMLPEQIWDASDIPGRERYFGHPSGSAQPLVWMHAEYVKLLRSLQDGRVFDQPPQPVRRYLIDQKASRYWIWRLNNKCRWIQAGKRSRVEVFAPAIMHWSTDGWQTTHDAHTRDVGLNVHTIDLPTPIASGTRIDFTFYWKKAAAGKVTILALRRTSEYVVSPTLAARDLNQHGAGYSALAIPIPKTRGIYYPRSDVSCRDIKMI